MGTIYDILNKAKSVAEAAGKKTSDFIELSKLRLEASDIEKDIASMLEGLGRLIYDARKSGDDISFVVDESFSKLDDRFEELKKLRIKIDEYGSRVRCSHCGAANADDAVYCKKCGKSIG